MKRNTRRSKGKHDWKAQSSQLDKQKTQQATSKDAKIKEAVFQRRIRENIYDQQKKYEAICEFKKREVICPVCNRRIDDMSSAIADKASGNPAHFECILDKITKSESLGSNEKVAYIGQGRFAVLHYENLHDVRTFKIVKTIEWESHDSPSKWREEMSALYSKVV